MAEVQLREILNWQSYQDVDKFAPPQEVCDKVNALIDAFLKEADLYSPKTVELFNKLPWVLSYRISQRDSSEKIATRCFLLKACIEYVQKNKLPPEFFQVGNRASPSYPPVPKNVSVATLIIDEHLFDPLTVSTGWEAIEEKVPLIVSSRTYLAMLQEKPPQLSLEKEWWVLVNKEKMLVVCLPKEAAGYAETLARLGYSGSELELLSSDLSPFEEMKDYQEKYAQLLPKLFVDPSVKKRFNCIGHGLSTTKLSDPNGEDTKGRYAGLTIAQFQKVVKQLEAVGMDYLNVITCFGGGRNQTEVFSQFPHKSTISVCSTSDYSVLGAILIPSETKFSIRLRKTAPFWQKMNQALDGKGELKAEDFESALESVYGFTLTGLPTISIQGKPCFEPVNVHKRACILRDQRDTSPREVKEEIVLVYPRLIQRPLHLHKSNGKFPPILSKIPDHNHLLIEAINTQEGSPKEVIQEALLDPFTDLANALMGSTTQTERIMVVKKISGSGQEVENVLIVKKRGFKGHSYVLFQRNSKWVLINNGKEEVEIAPEDAFHLIYKISKKLDLSPAALSYSPADAQTNETVRQCYWNWMGSAVAYSEAFGVMDGNDLGRFKEIVSALTLEQCKRLLFHAIETDKPEYVMVLKEKVKAVNYTDAFGRRLLTYAIKKGNLQIITTLLDMGCSLNASDYAPSLGPFHYAVKYNRPEVIQMLCERGIDQKQRIAALRKCLPKDKKSCFDALLPFVPSLQDVNDWRPLLEEAIKYDNPQLALQLAKHYDLKITHSYTISIFPSMVDRGHFKEWLEFIKMVRQRRSTMDEDFYCTFMLQWIDKAEVLQKWDKYNAEMKEGVIDFLREVLSLVKTDSQKSYVEHLGSNADKGKEAFQALLKSFPNIDINDD